RGTDASGVDEKGQTPLEAAIEADREDVALYLLDKGADLSRGPASRATLLERSRIAGFDELLKRLAPGDQVADTVPEPGPNQIYNAILTGDVAALRALVNEGAGPDTAPDGAAPLLHTAVITGALDVVEVLLGAGLPADAVHEGETAAQLAGRLGFWDIAARLDDDNARNATYALLAAISDRDLAQVETLISQDVDPTRHTPDSPAPLLEAVLAGDLEIIDRLLDAGADINFTDPDGTTALMIAVLANDRRLVEKLLLLGADPNIDVDGTPLLSMAVMTSEDTVATLLEFDADPKARDSDGVTPADLAWTMGNETLVTMLGGTELDQPPGMPLIEAIASMDAAAIRQALTRENPNQNTADGIPYLHVLLANAEQARPVEAFVSDPRTDLKVTSSKGHTVLDIALTRYSTDRSWWTRVMPAVTRSRHYGGQVHDFWMNAMGPEGRSGANKVVIAHAEPESVLRESSLKRLANAPDQTGMTPFKAAVLAGRVKLVQRFLEAGASTQRYSPSLQDVARSQENWAMLSVLPFDFFPPKELLSANGRSSAREVQRFMREEGYYSGKIDGAFRVQSIVAFRTMLKEKAEELKKVVMSDPAFALKPHSEPTIEGFFISKNNVYVQYETHVRIERTNSDNRTFSASFGSDGNPYFVKYFVRNEFDPRFHCYYGGVRSCGFAGYSDNEINLKEFFQ
ncbi:MAG: ankyrin repeat domain-containing protein, partial [Pseudomonadota bacterium]